VLERFGIEPKLVKELRARGLDPTGDPTGEPSAAMADA
jgi:hypothetical protein